MSDSQPSRNALGRVLAALPTIRQLSSGRFLSHLGPSAPADSGARPGEDGTRIAMSDRNWDKVDQNSWYRSSQEVSRWEGEGGIFEKSRRPVGPFWPDHFARPYLPHIHMVNVL